MTEAVMLVRNLLAPLAAVERTMVMPFDLDRHENSAEHSYILGALGCSLAPELDPGLDVGKIAQIALVHDLAKVYVGDITVWESDRRQEIKFDREQAALKRIACDYINFPWLGRTLREYHSLDSNESRYVRALCKLIPHIMIVAGDYHPVRPTRAAYERSEETARREVSRFPKLVPLFDELCGNFAASPQFFRD